MAFNLKRVFILFLLTTLLSSGVLAKRRKSKRTTINFEDQLIKGQNQKPDLMYIMQKKQFNYKRLIRLRENFLPEMRETANGIEDRNKIRLKKAK